MSGETFYIQLIACTITCHQRVKKIGHLAQTVCYIKERILLYQGNNCPKILVKFQMCWTCVEYPSFNLRWLHLLISLIEKNVLHVTVVAKLSKFDKNCNIKEGVCYMKETDMHLLHQGKLIVMSRKYLIKRMKHCD